MRLPCFLLACAAMLLTQGSWGNVPSESINLTQAILPVGTWKVEFANGVTEECDIFNFDGGHATVAEPRRSSRGTVVLSGDSAVITFQDDRVERWTSAGNRFIVEHWFPGSSFPAGTPVLGTAER